MDRKGIFQMKLNCQSVTKTFQNQTAVDKVSFTLSEPMICGLLGRNGAGKTTLLRMIANRFQPAAGQILLDESKRLGKRAGAAADLLCHRERKLWRDEGAGRHPLDGRRLPQL